MTSRELADRLEAPLGRQEMNDDKSASSDPARHQYRFRTYLPNNDAEKIQALAIASRRTYSFIVSELCQYGLEHVKVKAGACVDLYFE